MRPVNLIPPEDRRGLRAPLRTGLTAYLIIGALAAALVGVTFVVLTGNQITERENQVASLEANKAESSARAEALRPYADFAAISAARDETVTSLAESRFDWERVLNELALVIPDDVWLVRVAGSVSPDAQVGEGTAVESRASVPGPALELIGCGASTEAVARFLAALKDIDGVTRVGIDRAERREPTAADGSSSVGSVDTASEECRTRDFISRFEVVAAFDEAVPAAPAAGTETTVPTDQAPAVPGPDSESVADAQAQEQQARDSTQQQTDHAREVSSELVPGTVR
jgi:Tfp pilus assembly protein PilN